MGNRTKRATAALALCALAAIPACRIGADALRALEPDCDSRSRGSGSDGSLECGGRMPTGGANFTTYSHLGALLGRQAAHREVRAIVVDAFAALAASRPETTYVLGESGWPSGGPFAPHRTHQDGRSVDFMAPVLDAHSAPTTLPCWPWTKWGYAIDFDARGRRESMSIDFDAIAAHLNALERAARARGWRVERVILAPDLRDELARARGGQRALALPFMPRRAWVRHDDHYHVDFAPLR